VAGTLHEVEVGQRLDRKGQVMETVLVVVLVLGGLALLVGLGGAARRSARSGTAPSPAPSAPPPRPHQPPRPGTASRAQTPFETRRETEALVDGLIIGHHIGRERAERDHRPLQDELDRARDELRAFEDVLASGDEDATDGGAGEGEPWYLDAHPADVDHAIGDLDGAEVDSLDGLDTFDDLDGFEDDDY
jgi:hypothetical protein